MPASIETTDKQIAELTEKFINGGHTLKGLRGLSDQSMETIYALAFSHYNGGRFHEAITLFNFLCLNDPFKKKYWLGLGAARQLTKDYEGAVLAYSMGGVTEIGDPNPALHAADCYLLLGQADKAEKALTAAIHWAEQKPEYGAIKTKAESLLKLLSEKKKSNPEEAPALSN